MTALTRARSLPMWRAFAIPDFRLLWASETVSVIGDQFHYVALSWLIIRLTGSGLALGTVLIAIGIPRAILMAPFGVIADRRSSRSLMFAAHVARGVIVGTIAALAITGTASIPALAVLGALFGAADAAYLPAQQAFLPRTVEADRLPSANALVQGTLQMASIAGPPIAGAVIAVVGTGAAFSVDAVSFFVAAGIVLLMARPKEARAPEPAEDVGAAEPAAPQAKASFRDELLAGIRYVAADPALRMLLVVSLVLNFALNGPAAVGMAWLADRRFDAGPTGLGLMAAGWAAGALIGTLVAGNLKLERQGRVVVGAFGLAGVMMAAVGILGWLPGVVAALAIMGVAIGYVNILGISWLQARVEPAMIGRVMSLVMLMSFGITPLSLGIAGALIDASATLLFVSAGGLVIVTALAAAAVRLPAMLDADPRAGRASA